MRRLRASPCPPPQPKAANDRRTPRAPATPESGFLRATIILLCRSMILIASAESASRFRPPHFLWLVRPGIVNAVTFRS